MALITPEFCENYLRAWTADRQRWQRHLKQPFIRNIQQISGPERRQRALAALSRPGAPHLIGDSARKAAARSCAIR